MLPLPHSLSLQLASLCRCCCRCSGRAILLDVRLGSKYEAGHAEGSLSTPLYLPIQKWDVASSIRRAGFAFFGIYGTGGWGGGCVHTSMTHVLHVLHMYVYCSDTNMCSKLVSATQVWQSAGL
jgi:hypothetical protein